MLRMTDCLFTISFSEIARDNEDEGTGDFIQKDMGTGMPFRPGSFDGAIRLL